MNVGDIKKAIAGLPDDTPFFVCQGSDAWEGKIRVHCERGFYTPYFQIDNLEHHRNVPYYAASGDKNDTIRKRKQKQNVKIPLLKETESTGTESTHCVCTDLHRQSYADTDGIRRCDLCDKPLEIQF